MASENLNCFSKMVKKKKISRFFEPPPGGNVCYDFFNVKKRETQKCLIFPLSDSKPFCPLWGPKNFPIFWNRTHQNIIDWQQCVHFQNRKKVVNHSTLMHTVPNNSGIFEI